MNKIEKIIQKLELQPHPEGGYFKETYRSAGEINHLPSKYKGKRNHSTCIYFLLTSAYFSAFHRINQDEIWHFYDGSPINLHMISEDGSYSKVIIGRDFDAGFHLQYVVPGGTWFAANVINPAEYSLVGCTVAPGFDFKDFELLDRKSLLTKFPQHLDIILQLTKN